MRDLDPKALPDPRLADPAAADSSPPRLEVSDAVAGFHRAVCERLTDAEHAPPGCSMDPRSTAPQYDVLISALSEHLAVMERVLHPELLRRCAGDPRVGELAPLAAEIVRVMRGLEQHLYGDARAPQAEPPELHARLVGLLARHTELEETLLRQVEAGMTVEERRALADRLETASRHAPTRPHPHAPHSPRLVPLAFRLNALWDDALDAMDVRQVSGRRRPQPKPVGLWGSYLFGSGMVEGPGPRGRDERSAGR
jgi:hypothetical protein